MRQGHTWFADIASGLLVAGSLASLLPKIAAGLGMVYYVLGVWDSPSGRRWRTRWRGLFYIVTRETEVPEPTEQAAINELKRKLEDVRIAHKDRLLIAVCLGLGGSGIAMALAVIFYGAL